MALVASTLAHAEDVLDGKKLVFLVGAPRSGTTWLQLLLSRSPSVVTVHETNLFNRFMRSMVQEWNHGRSTRSLVGVSNLLSDEEFRVLLRGVSATVLAKIAKAKPSATVILEKTPEHVNCWREILGLWPGAYFIHIIRDPRSVVASLRVASKSWARQWASSKISANCERWISAVSNGRQISAATNNYQEVTFEELVSEGPAVLIRLFANLGVGSSLDECRRYAEECKIENLKAGKLDNAPFEMTNRNQSYRIGATDSWRFELSKWDIALIEHLAGPLMSELGFARTESNKAISFLVDVSCAASNAGRIMRRWTLQRAASARTHLRVSKALFTGASNRSRS